MNAVIISITGLRDSLSVFWVGYLVHGITSQVDQPIIPEPSGFSPKVDGDIILGLREDGVVVWKHAADSTQ